MIRAPDNATCPAHPDEPAPTVCERCGVFMCRGCSARYAEDRCPKCRPRYGAAELAERRLNRVRKVDYVRCDVCELEGPRFDRVEPVSLKMLVFAPVLSIASFGPLGLIYLLTSIGATQPMCPGCERSDGLEPSLEEDLPQPPGWDELTQRDTRTRLRNTALVTVTLALVVGAAALAFSAVVR